MLLCKKKKSAKCVNDKLWSGSNCKYGFIDNIANWYHPLKYR